PLLMLRRGDRARGVQRNHEQTALRLGLSVPPMVSGRGIVFSKKTLQHLQYVYRGGGITAVLVRAGRRLLAPLYEYKVRYILLRKVPARDEFSSADEEGEDQTGECILLESPGTLQAMEREIPSSLTHSLSDLSRYLEQGAIVFLAFTSRQGGAQRAF